MSSQDDCSHIQTAQCLQHHSIISQIRTNRTCVQLQSTKRLLHATVKIPSTTRTVYMTKVPLFTVVSALLEYIWKRSTAFLDAFHYLWLQIVLVLLDTIKLKFVDFFTWKELLRTHGKIWSWCDSVSYNTSGRQWFLCAMPTIRGDFIIELLTWENWLRAKLPRASNVINSRP